MDEVILPLPRQGEACSDSQAMSLAIQVAKQGVGYVSPNPLVGCVILDSQNRFLKAGFHARYGEAHAEIHALQGLTNEQLKDSKIFVTLEPCAHQGRTPSCAKALAVLPIQEVIYGLVDPNPLVAGQGAKILQDAGKKATLWQPGAEGPSQLDLEELCEHFLLNFREKRPFVSLKAATSLDGFLALQNGQSKWITGPESRKYGHYLRAAHDAMLVGVNTILFDDPRLDIRHDQFPGLEKKLVVLDPAGALAEHLDLQIWQVHRPENVIWVTGPEVAKTKGIPAGVGHLQGLTDSEKVEKSFDLKHLLMQLRSLGIQSILVEGGAQTLSSFITAKEAQRLYLFQAPILLGGGSGKSWSERVTIKGMDQRLILKQVRRQVCGEDLLTTGRFNW